MQQVPRHPVVLVVVTRPTFRKRTPPAGGRANLPDNIDSFRVYLRIVWNISWFSTAVV